MTHPVFIKKVLVKDERGTPAARAERLRRLRHLANFSRQQLCDAAGLKLPTLKRWELGLYGGLPLDGASKIIACVAKAGVQCSLEWLLHGEGTFPRLFEVNSPRETSTQTNNYIDEEVELFKQHYSNSMDCVVTDDGMLPFYTQGEHVAGVPYYADDIRHAIGLACIVELHTGEKIIRKVQAGIQPNVFTLECTNNKAQVKEPIRFNIKLVSAAPILRVYRQSHFFPPRGNAGQK